MTRDLQNDQRRLPILRDTTVVVVVVVVETRSQESTSFQIPLLRQVKFICEILNTFSLGVFFWENKENPMPMGILT